MRLYTERANSLFTRATTVLPAVFSNPKLSGPDIAIAFGLCDGRGEHSFLARCSQVAARAWLVKFNIRTLLALDLAFDTLLATPGVLDHLVRSNREREQSPFPPTIFRRKTLPDACISDRSLMRRPVAPDRRVIADVLCVTAVQILMLHECGHVLHDHTTPTYGLRDFVRVRELAADYFAVNEMLRIYGSQQGSAQARSAWAAGVCFSIFTLFELEDPTGFSFDSHYLPPTSRRKLMTTLLLERIVGVEPERADQLMKECSRSIRDAIWGTARLRGEVVDIENLRSQFLNLNELECETMSQWNTYRILLSGNSMLPIPPPIDAGDGE